MGYAKLTGDHARTNASGCHFDDSEADVIGKRTAVDEDTAELVYSSLTCKKKKWSGVLGKCTSNGIGKFKTDLERLRNLYSSL